MDYLEQYNNDYEKVKRFFEEKKYKEFKIGKRWTKYRSHDG